MPRLHELGDGLLAQTVRELDHGSHEHLVDRAVRRSLMNSPSILRYWHGRYFR